VTGKQYTAAQQHEQLSTKQKSLDADRRRLTGSASDVDAVRKHLCIETGEGRELVPIVIRFLRAPGSVLTRDGGMFTTPLALVGFAGEMRR